jgi:membrane protease YdiL (CAAX protease family)
VSRGRWQTNFVAAFVLVAMLVVCNVAFVYSHGYLQLLWILLGYLGLWGVYTWVRLQPEETGLARRDLGKGLRYAAWGIIFILIACLLIQLFDKHIFKDPRYNQSFPAALYAALLLLPVKTVLFEELAFRGIFPALLLRLKANRWLATLISSLAFGLWHITSAMGIGNYQVSGDIAVPKVGVVLATILATTTAGIILCTLRWRSGSLVTPIALHWFLNGLAIMLAAFSWH